MHRVIILYCIPLYVYFVNWDVRVIIDVHSITRWIRELLFQCYLIYMCATALNYGTTLKPT
ncbi:uncharacterized protein EDB91DRAFT_1171608 [Suillus paluster]|uniref:uncharacterized protein n=1 Tax=Suillus paluster TaxID=48578 RepID=UPI001B874A89|nr:uncharacterized protein EDB91DRAFT_1171608 [Suillus paluster]KAG1723970.1 hypothetical protein EDB91DRAFT_1171608 [Suillus paluster]